MFIMINVAVGQSCRKKHKCVVQYNVSAVTESLGHCIGLQGRFTQRVEFSVISAELLPLEMI